MTVATTLAVGKYDVPADSITVTGRLRSVRPEIVDNLRRSIRLLGIMEPIGVTTEGRLIWGAHRLEAAKREGMLKVPAQVLDVDDDEARLMEVDENLRSPLTILEQGEHLAERSAVLARLNQRAQRGDNRYTARPANMTGLPLRTVDLAAELAISESSARRRLRVDLIDPEVRDAIRETRVADNLSDLVALSRLQADQQRAVAEVISGGMAASVSGAQKYLNPVEEPPDEDDAFNDADIPERLNIVHAVVKPTFSVASERTRTRGDRIYPRESEEFQCEIPVTVGSEIRAKGIDGLREFANEIARAVYNHPAVRNAWLRIPPSGSRDLDYGRE